MNLPHPTVQPPKKPPKRKRKRKRTRRNHTWGESFQQVVDYKKTYGEGYFSNFRSKSKCAKLNKHLHSWTKTQRAELKKLINGLPSDLTQGQVDQLSSISFPWTPFDFGLETYLRYRRENPNERVIPKREGAEWKKISNWCNTQRMNYGKWKRSEEGGLTDEQVSILMEKTKVLEEYANDAKVKALLKQRASAASTADTTGPLIRVGPKDAGSDDEQDAPSRESKRSKKTGDSENKGPASSSRKTNHQVSAEVAARREMLLQIPKFPLHPDVTINSDDKWFEVWEKLEKSGWKRENMYGRLVGGGGGIHFQCYFFLPGRSKEKGKEFVEFVDFLDEHDIRSYCVRNYGWVRNFSLQRMYMEGPTTSTCEDDSGEEHAAAIMV